MTKIRISDHARALHDDALICDLTLPWGNWEEGKDTILSRYRDRRFDFVSLSVGLDRMGFEETVHRVARERARLREWSDWVHFVESADDIHEARRLGKLAVGFHFQGSNPLGGDPNMVALYHRLGVRHMLLAYNQKNLAADGCHERTDMGLSRFGRRVVEELERSRMILDCTHTGYRSSMEAIEMSSQPVMFSHSNAHAVYPHARNIKDDQIEACAATGGLIGITGVGHFLCAEMTACAEAFVQHVDYVAERVGPEHVGIGLDHVYYLGHKAVQRAGAPDMYPAGYPPPGAAGSYFGPEHLIEIVELLVRRGYGDRDIRAILGGNFLRIASQVWSGGGVTGPTDARCKTKTQGRNA